MSLARGTLVAVLMLLALFAASSSELPASEAALLPGAPVPEPTSCLKFDEYSDLKFEDEQARLDNFATQLKAEPGAQGQMVVFGSCEGEAASRLSRALDYLKNKNGIERERVVPIDGGCRELVTVELWMCPKVWGAMTPVNSSTVSPCPVCKKARPVARRRKRSNKRVTGLIPNGPPAVKLNASLGTVMILCPWGPSCTPNSDQTVRLTANASDPDADTLLYTYSATAGIITGEGPNVTWDLKGVGPGNYTATVEVDDGLGGLAYSSTYVRVDTCDCHLPCPTISISCPTDQVKQGTPATVSVNLSGVSPDNVDPNTKVNYNWTVTAGTIMSGQGTPTITVDTTGLQSRTVTATVEIGGLAPECDRARSCTFSVSVNEVLGDIPCRPFDQYEAISPGEETLRLENVALQLQQAPGSKFFYIVFGSREGEADERATSAVDYLVNKRGVDRSRVRVVDSGCREKLTAELWICTMDAGAPYPINMATVSPCPAREKMMLPRGRQN